MLSQEIFRALFTGSVFGAILFFATVIGPTTFKVLDGDSASDFLRKLIPRYFLFIIITAGLGAFSSWEQPLQATGLAAISLTSIILRQVALPQVLGWRDMQMDGDTASGQKFIRGRRFILAVTTAQFLIAGGVLARIAG
ncbi:DUF4149 domain-containing protein [Parvularcula sp. ZS-1/3]|uniref:DUF4149 domain-containing protein n=1 Tax=Parvularcula mediterranea TaxID=2732508 RepID=A0A7Y3RKB7_9PROT|nr:DUF4149 domain-containing protein [Parvularcula mediterranea]NNU15580.1 DUF4149 domain-containing protein [Parvularcula mediterranea]